LSDDENQWNYAGGIFEEDPVGLGLFREEALVSIKQGKKIESLSAMEVS